MSTRFRFLIFCLGVAMGTAALSACAPTVDIRGNVPNPDKLAQIKPGVQTREQVAGLLDTPVARTTSAPGAELGLIEQLFGNIGRVAQGKRAQSRVAPMEPPAAPLSQPSDYLLEPPPPAPPPP